MCASDRRRRVVPRCGPLGSDVRPPNGSELTGDPELQQLYDEVTRTRTEHRHELGNRVDAAVVFATREASLEALENYVAALQERHLPTPPTMHRDLKLLRMLCADARSRRIR
jgi:hypothetical protein